MYANVVLVALGAGLTGGALVSGVFEPRAIFPVIGLLIVIAGLLAHRALRRRRRATNEVAPWPMP